MVTEFPDVTLNVSAGALDEQNAVSLWLGSSTSEEAWNDAVTVKFSDDGDFLGSKWALRHIRSRTAIEACSGAELERFQQDRNLELPAAYVRFLEALGSSSGQFLQGSDFLFEQLDGLQSGAQALLEEDEGPALPEDTFVFCSHQGYQFLFFNLGEGG